MKERKKESLSTLQGDGRVSLQTQRADAADRSLREALKAKLGQLGKTKLHEIKQENDLVHQKVSLTVLWIKT